ncbi:hypothetical protein [Chloroflexus sp.]|uniref:hypothetical protein n=1 Tax=Chloroflexus sp. TaxID=1904827 RepID=UPI002587DCE8|nr:hypothetical protein [Chloroflexus sp.]
MGTVTCTVEWHAERLEDCELAVNCPIREVAVEPVKQYGLPPTDAKGQPIACGANTRLSGERTLAQVGSRRGRYSLWPTRGSRGGKRRRSRHRYHRRRRDRGSWEK